MFGKIRQGVPIVPLIEAEKADVSCGPDLSEGGPGAPVLFKRGGLRPEGSRSEPFDM